MRKLTLVMIIMGCLTIISLIRLQLKIERTKLKINNIVEEMQRCGRVYLLSTRDDVIQTMGQPAKEEVVPSVTGGLANRLYFQYTAIKVEHMPYVDIDQHFNKVVAIDCAFTRNDLKTLIKKGQAQMPREEALPGPAQRQ